MIVLGLAINYFQVILMVIVLLNLLIAIISEEYTKVIDDQVKLRFQEKTDMILEYWVYKRRHPFRFNRLERIGMYTILSPKGTDA